MSEAPRTNFYQQKEWVAKCLSSKPILEFDEFDDLLIHKHTTFNADKKQANNLKEKQGEHFIHLPS